MGLLADRLERAFDTNEIKRGDCVRVRRAGSGGYRNGFVTKATERRVEALCCDAQGSAAIYVALDAADAAIGAWEIYWTADFMDVRHEPAADQAGGIA